jgi:hypothetical protein
MKTKSHYRVHKRPQPASTLNQMNPFYSLKFNGELSGTASAAQLYHWNGWNYFLSVSKGTEDGAIGWGIAV